MWCSPTCPNEDPDAAEVIKLVEAAGRKAVPAPGDLSTEQGNIDLVQKAVDELGHIDILVSVAGKQVYVKTSPI